MTTDPTSYHRIVTDSFTAWYGARRDSWSSERAMRNAARYLLENISRDRLHHVLDIGTGRGADLELFLKAGYRATGVDLVEVETWDQLRSQWGASLTLVKSSFQNFETTERFTAALDVGCLHHQHPADYATYLNKLHGMLVPGARCVFSVFTPHDEASSSGECIVLDDQRISRFLSADEMRAYFREGNFRWISSERWRRDRIDGYYLAILVERA